MNKKIILYLCICILATSAVYVYYSVPAVQEQIALWTEEDFTEDNIYSDLESLSVRLDEEILSGAESFTVYLKDMDINEIDQINASLDGIFGSGNTYQQVGVVGNTYNKVTITVKRTINYYAYCAYVNQTPIPESEEKAKKLYKVVKKILDSEITDTMSDYEKELALHDYLVTHCKYSENAKQDSESDIYRAYGALVNQDAVCNGYAEALQLLFMCAGIRSEFVVGTADGIDHAWNLVELDGKWYHLDATWDDPKPDQGENILHPYFNVPDALIAESHTWNREDYPAAEDMTYNYYVKSGAYFENFEDYKGTAYKEMIHNGKQRYEAMIKNYVENEEDMQFIFEDNYRYNSVSWQSFEQGTYSILILEAK